MLEDYKQSTGTMNNTTQELASPPPQGFLKVNTDCYTRGNPGQQRYIGDAKQIGIDSRTKQTSFSPVRTWREVVNFGADKCGRKGAIVANREQQWWPHRPDFIYSVENQHFTYLYYIFLA
ncbi:hypothetical protein IFM89_025497 [Coptis chinensis]|uniref:Uncharacterized protein n=1 Tax=Coptis chinensis TaxID=261450 RepID=A0A835HBA5_9MAGN|nr:hypothetical protein IFM89_025497 [Coptis chinensis]